MYLLSRSICRKSGKVPDGAYTVVLHTWFNIYLPSQMSIIIWLGRLMGGGPGASQD